MPSSVLDKSGNLTAVRKNSVSNSTATGHAGPARGLSYEARHELRP